MDVWEIVNPSDRYTIVGLKRIVSYCVLVVGGGQLALRHVETDEAGFGDLCVFSQQAQRDAIRDIAGSNDADAFDRFLESHRQEIIDALRSVRIGDREEAPEGWGEMLKWHDEERSSENDIGRACWQAADALEKAMATT